MCPAPHPLPGRAACFALERDRRTMRRIPARRSASAERRRARRWASMLSGPPADDSPEHREEVATLLHWQAKRTAEDVARCRSEEEVTAFMFAEVLGDWFNARSLPVTANLMNQVYVDTRGVSNSV